MNEAELEQCRTLLGVSPTATHQELERAFMKKNFALIKGNTGDEPKQNVDIERQRLRTAHERLAAHLKEQTEAAAKGPRLVVPGPDKAVADAAWSQNRAEPKTLITPPVVTPPDPADEGFSLLRFDHWGVNVFVPPLLLGLVWLVNLSPLKFLLQGFHVWMHEFGHAVPAWLSGWRATPLPFGWTPVEQEHSNFVYGGLLLMFGILFVAGWKERKLWAMLVAVVLAGLQAYMTWRLPEARKEFWMVFGGVGGEFALSTLFMMAFWVQLPEKFRWGACRYVFFFIGATAFLNIWVRWGDIYRGIEEIPFGSMINGEEDGGGDMNRLMDDYGWKKFDIRHNYRLLGSCCWVALGFMWTLFALRLNRVADWVAGRFGKTQG